MQVEALAARVRREGLETRHVGGHWAVNHSEHGRKLMKQAKIDGVTGRTLQ